MTQQSDQTSSSLSVRKAERLLRAGKATLANIKAIAAPIISITRRVLSILISSLAHKQFTAFTATSDTNKRGKAVDPGEDWICG